MQRLILALLSAIVLLLAGCGQSGVNYSAETESYKVLLNLDVDGARCRLDPVLMECAVANLVRNAVSVSKRGQTVEVTCTPSPPSTGAG